MHLFIDESGNFHQNDGIRIIGGVLLFGNYGQAEENSLGASFNFCLDQFQCLVPIFRPTMILSILQFFHPFFGHELFHGIIPIA